MPKRMSWHDHYMTIISSPHARYPLCKTSGSVRIFNFFVYVLGFHCRNKCMPLFYTAQDLFCIKRVVLPITKCSSSKCTGKSYACINFRCEWMSSLYERVIYTCLSFLCKIYFSCSKPFHATFDISNHHYYKKVMSIWPYTDGSNNVQVST